MYNIFFNRNKGEYILALSSVLSLVDNESQMQHTACWQGYNTDSRIAQEAASALTLWWHGQNAVSSDNPVLWICLSLNILLSLLSANFKSLLTPAANNGRTFTASKIRSHIINLILLQILIFFSISLSWLKWVCWHQAMFDWQEDPLMMSFPPQPDSCSA